jgi:hypothetical protein
MIGTIIQPPYLPWLGFFDRVLKTDVVVLLDSVAMDRNSRTKFVNRNKLRTKDDWTWVTVPLAKGPRDQAIADLEINNDEAWAERHWRAVETNYKHAPHFAEHAGHLEAIYRRPWGRLVDLNVALLDYLFVSFDMRPRIEFASKLGAEGKGGALLIDICRRVGIDAYVSGPFGRNYIEQGEFEAAGIDLYFHDYAHPSYQQAFAGFEPFMSALDLLMNQGKAGRELLQSPVTTLARR